MTDIRELPAIAVRENLVRYAAKEASQLVESIDGW
jgi:hypothetical protein